jgi:hypothetical protein
MTDVNDMPVLGFGRYKGQRLDRVPSDYVRWLADPKRDEPSPPRPGRRAGGHKPLPADVVAAARGMIAAIDVRDAEIALYKAIMGGAAHDRPHALYAIEVGGDLYRRHGETYFGETVHGSLDAALARLLKEYPLEPRDAEEDAFHGREPNTEMVRSTPDPEDDRILVWEVLPTGHRKVVWGFFGWHWTSDEYACGQGTLPGDDEDLYSLAMKEY